ncbi:hypothetical protein E3E12_04945 [Formicincola oecophyllae]|uniref:Uncharacterized protein n=1 Tax=Formicincola oecophyllae TaxID=2558361 RepID=A0A4Y6UC03_9PROT|nr:hypothetical protein [Formicincola oecophyllae]QDH13645.1 hypothetical protein E3E12_04945 [Formicincola oecophyllae]
MNPSPKPHPLGNLLRTLDLAVLNRVFQPCANHLPVGLSSWALGNSLVLGSIVFEAAAVVMPMVLYGATWGESLSNCLLLLSAVLVYVAFQRLGALVRPGMANPLQFMLWGLRVCFGLISLGNMVALLWHPPSPSMWVWDWLYEISLMVFVAGIYFMSCQPRSPSQRKAPQGRFKAQPSQTGL